MNATTTGPPDPSRHRMPTGAGASAADAGSNTGRPSGRRRWLTGLVIAAPLALAGCNFYPSYGASRGVTEQAQDTFKLWSGMMTTGIIVFVIVMALILWAIIRYRKRSDEMPVQFHENVPIEIIYTAVPIIMVLVLFWFTVLTENKVDATQPVAATTTASGAPVVDITVTAFQWGWRFDYPGLNIGVAGELTAGPDNHGPQMVVPVGETVQITLVSDDVIHGFYLRDFNFSRYAQPGVTNIFDLNLVKTGTFNGQCTQFCGLYHSEMLFTVKSVSPSQFETWASSEVHAGHILQNSGSPSENNPPAGENTDPASATALPTATPKPKAST